MQWMPFSGQPIFPAPLPQSSLPHAAIARLAFHICIVIARPLAKLPSTLRIMDSSTETNPSAASQGTSKGRKVLWFSVIGLVALLGISLVVVQKARRSSVEKAVLGNFRQLGAALDQYYLEFPDHFFVTYGEIVGPGRYIKGQNSIQGEDYSVLFPMDRHRRNFFQTVRLSNGREVTDTYDKVEPPNPPDGVHIEAGPNREKYETTWRGGVRHGLFRAWRADGKLWSEATFKEGRVEGPCWLHLPDGSRIDELSQPRAP